MIAHNQARFRVVGILQSCLAAIVLCFEPQTGNAALASKTAIERLGDERFLPRRILPLSISEKADTEATFLLEMLERPNGTDVITRIEAFIENNPESPWRSSLESNLGMIYHHRGRCGDALKSFRSVWAMSKGVEGHGKQIADTTLPSLLGLLSSLGRAEELWPILSETADRPLPTGPVSLAREYALDAYYMMVNHPAKSFRCGTFALASVAREMGIPEVRILDLIDIPSGTNGFTMQQLVGLSEERNIPLIPVIKPAGAKPIIPSVVHWKVNHYAAIIREENDMLLVVDPTFGRPRWFSQTDFEREASGAFLIPKEKKPLEWQMMSETQVGLVFGRGLINNIADWMDRGCLEGEECPPCAGVPVWWVSEPYVNLWIADEPLSYNTKRKERKSFRVTFKQRDDRQQLVINNLPMGPHWTHSWNSYIEVEDPVWNPSHGSSLQKFQFWNATVHLANGEVATFSNSQLTDPTTRLRLEPMLGPNKNPLTGLVDTHHRGFRLIYPDGRCALYGLPSHQGGAPVTAVVWLSEMIDANGNTNSFQYEVIGTKTSLARMIDYDGNTNTLTYTNDHRLWEIRDPYNRYTRFTYNPSNWVSSITDAEGLITTFQYNNNSGWITNMTTPYGATGFDYPQDQLYPNEGNAGGHNRINRAVRVAEPNAGNQLFIYKYDTDTTDLHTGFTSEYIPNNIPIGSTLDSAGMGTGTNYSSFTFRNSFHWGQKQYPLLSSTDPANFGASDFKYARIKHWLEDQNGLFVSEALSIKRDPSHCLGINVTERESWRE